MASDYRDAKAMMRRFFVEPQDISEKNAVVYGQEFLHITKVLRCREGEPAILLDGTGVEYITSIQSIQDDHVLFNIIEKHFSAAEPNVKLTLYQGLPKSLKLDIVVQKCVELGVFEITPFISKRCVKIPDKGFLKKIERLNKIAKEAVKQCKRAIIPKTNEVIDFNGLKDAVKSHDLTLVCYEDEQTLSLKHALSDNDAKNIGVIIGPEGGFEPSEIETLNKSGVKSITLGKRILRTETAGMAAICMILYEKGEMA